MGGRMSLVGTKRIEWALESGEADMARSIQLFLDTASVLELKKYLGWGVVEGITTNQKLFSLEGDCDFEQRIRELCAKISGPVSVETTAHEYDELVEEGRYYSSLAPNLVVKVAMYKDGTGLRAVRTLASERISTNVTTLMSAQQAFLAAKAGATYVSLFYRRIKDAGQDPEREIRICAELLERGGLPSRIIAGSIRDPQDVISAMVAGAHIVTVPPKVLEQMPFHAKTEETIEEFDRAWEEFRTATVALSRSR